MLHISYKLKTIKYVTLLTYLISCYKKCEIILHDSTHFYIFF